ncbi:hypothetical protein R1sor_020426 [Riccia sorocarpa]|uniref:FCP1 homology domain-containing protein n=1 Tax=Riccia sorocarpa TaxID=122646 RepID=A0ABD3IIP2_9MARC
MVPEKGEGAEALNIKNKVPRWEFVNLSSPDGKPLTHPIYKRGGFCYMMVINFSKAESTVLDFFSGGIFAREALLSGRDVIYFVNSEQESIFLKEYGKALERYSDRVRSWYKRYKSLKVPTSSSPQPALASSSQQPGLASTSQQPARAVTDEDEIEDTDAAKFVFDHEVENEARIHLGRRPRLQLAVGVVAEEFNQEESNDNQDLDPALCTPRMGSRMQDSNDQGSLVEAVKQVNTGKHEEDGPLALVLHHSRSVGSSHFEENPHVPLLPEHSVEAAIPIPPCETLDINEDNPVLEDQIPDLPVLATDHEDVGISSVQQDVQADINASGLLAPIETPIFWVPDLNQVPNPLVKASDLLPRKLLILDVEGLLVYAEGFMDRSSKTTTGDDVGAKKVIRRNGVQKFITRCLELFDIALWTCNDRNLSYDYTHYLFTGEQWDKFLFRWDQGKALDTKERWTRNNREIRLVLKPLKTVWERFPDFNARNTLLVDVHPYRASANPEDTGIFPKPYTGSPSDKYLTTVLLLYLEGLSQAFDIREYVREHVLQGSQRPLHFRATSRGLPGLLHKYSVHAIETCTFVPLLLTKRGKLTDFEKTVLRRLPDIDQLEDHDCVAWARLLGLSWNQAL